MQSLNIAYNPRLDHLRFFAAFIVLMFHTNAWYMSVTGRDRFRVPILDHGYTGVALFMVISGMILTLITYGREIDAKRFYLNRLLRIYPLFVVIVTLGYFATPDPRETSVGIDYLMALLPISNLYRLKYGVYGGAMFSVMIEMQFYLMFPILALMLRQRGVRFYLTLIAFLLLLRVIVFALTGTVHNLGYFSIFGALDLFLIGCLAGVYHTRTQEKRISGAWWLLAVVAINVAIYFMHRPGALFHVNYRQGPSVSNSVLWIVWPTLQGLLWAGLVLAYLKGSFALPFSKIWAYLGKISYSLYAWHTIACMLAVAYIAPILGSAYLTGLVVVLPFAVAVSALSYYLIESPFLALRTRYVKADAPEGQANARVAA
jgi:peptidoglycan/LPS O-acetylase OafA/YrhL